MKTSLTTLIAENADISEVIETVKQRHKESKLPDIEVVRILWDAIMDAVQWSGKNQQQNSNLALRQVKTWAKLLDSFCTTAKLQLEIMYKIQIQCYEDAKLVKLFPEISKKIKIEHSSLNTNKKPLTLLIIQRQLSILPVIQTLLQDAEDPKEQN
jgi:hypothetical protein